MQCFCQFPANIFYYSCAENTCPQAEEGRVHTAETRKIVDELLLLHLLRCLKYLIRDRDLPLLVSSLWGTVKK